MMAQLLACLAAMLVAVTPMPLVAQDAASCPIPPQLQSVLTSHPSASAYAAVGAYFGQHGQYACAIPAFQSAVRLAPGSWQSRYYLGLALLAAGSPRQALGELQKAAQLRPGTAQIEISLGNALAQLNRNDDAIDAFKKALSADPHSVPALDSLAKVLIVQERYTAAIEYLKNAPRDETLQLDLAIAYERNAQIDPAIKVLTALIVYHPENVQAHVNLGVAYARRNRYTEAAQQFAKVLELNPSDDTARAEYLQTLILTARFDTAAPIARDYLARKPNEFQPLYLAGVIDRALKDYAAAETHLSKAVALNPANYEARYNLGFVLARLGKPAEAREQLEAALRLHPDSADARFQLALALRSLGQESESQQELQHFEQEKAKHVEADIAVTQQNQANESLEAGNVQQAIALYRQSIANDPKNPHAYYNLAHALDQQRDYRGEREALGKAIALNGNFAPAHNQLGLLHLRANETADAESQFKTAIALDPQYADAQNNLGVLYAQLGRNAAAEKLFRQAIENQPKYDQPYINLGLILLEERQFTEAEQTLHSALALSPHNQTALAALATVQNHRNSSHP